MITSTINYQGQLRTTCTHMRSDMTLITDAPVDNHGKGEAFSPTDLLATSLGSCMLTTMGIKAMQKNIPFSNAHAEITKIMAANPRRVIEIVVHVRMPETPYTAEQRSILEDAGINCPVAKSLSEEIIQRIDFVY